jgi:selenocysteine lyase/cysteine desulfurase
VKVLGPSLETPTLAVATFVVEDVPHSLVAARMGGEYGIGVRAGRFCAHPYVNRLLGLSHEDQSSYRERARRGDKRGMPGAVRASATLSTTRDEVDVFLAAMAEIAGGKPPPVPFAQDERTGGYWPELETPEWSADDRIAGAGC